MRKYDIRAGTRKAGRDSRVLVLLMFTHTHATEVVQVSDRLLRHQNQAIF